MTSTFLSLVLTPLLAVMPLQADMASIPGAGTPAAATTQIQSLQIRVEGPANAAVEPGSSSPGYRIVVTDASGLPVHNAAVALRLPDEGPTGFFSDGARSAVVYTDAAGVANFLPVHWGSAGGAAAIKVTAVKGDLHAGMLIEQRIGGQNTAEPPYAPHPALKIPAAAIKPAPGTPASVAGVRSGAAAELQSSSSTQTAADPDQAVSIVNTSASTGGSHGSNKKWILLALAAVGAGVGVAVAMSGKGGATAATAAPGLSIGTPTISVGH